MSEEGSFDKGTNGGLLVGVEVVDHFIDLQMGGADGSLNMNPLDMSVNRSLGPRVGPDPRLGARYSHSQCVDLFEMRAIDV